MNILNWKVLKGRYRHLDILLPLVQGILNTLKRVKVRLADANHARDPTHFTIPEILRQTEDEISLVCNRKQMSIYDMQPPPQVSL